MSLASGTKLGPYEIVSLLGAGGMGEVYRARDPRLGRDVAAKVLPEEFFESEERRGRFEREARMLASLNHPGIAALYSFEEIPVSSSSPSSSSSTFHVLVMELLEGETLRERLRAGPLPARKAVEIAAQMAKALAAAHEKGIVHRDLKPENVFLTKDERVKILDFGLAKLSQREQALERQADVGTVSLLTEAGSVMGTAGYMSPEQVRGEPVDTRSDLFSFGTVLHEMLSGRNPFGRDTRAETMTAILREEPPELTKSGKSASPALDRVVRHCLEKGREERFQTAKDIAFALSEASGQAMASEAKAPARGPRKPAAIVGAAAVALLAFSGMLLFRRPGRTEAVPSGPKRIAVLPFENLGAAEDDYFVDGMADEIRGKLTSLPGLEVIARASSTTYRKTTKAPKQIAQELDVKYLLMATVRWDKSAGSSRVHVSPELVEARGPGEPAARWQQPFDATLTDVFRVQADVAARVAVALGVALGAGEEKRLLEKPTQNLAAWDAFLKGEEAARTGSSGARKALVSYEQAVALDPGFAQAWARVSQVNWGLFRSSGLKPEFGERARLAAERAVALAPGRSEGHLAFGEYLHRVRSDPKSAIEHLERARRIAPGDAEVLLATGWAEEALGRWDAAVEYFKVAVRLDPRLAEGHASLGWALVCVRRYPEARDVFDRGLALAPTNLFMIESRAETFLGEGDLEGARLSLRAAPKEVDPAALVVYLANVDGLFFVLDEKQRELLLSLTPRAFNDNRGSWGLCLAEAYASKGDVANVRTHAEEARRAYEEQVRAAPEDARRHVVLGLALAYLGRKEEAIREGERGVALLPAGNSLHSLFSRLLLVRIRILVGDLEKAVDELEVLEEVPYFFVSPAWLGIDPVFDPLRKNPRFQKLVAVR